MSLVGEERKQRIIELIEAEHKVTVDQLTELFKVSRETVRRYLNELEAQGKLKKVYGGAIKVNHGKIEPSYIERESKYAAEKLAIGKKAAAQIQPNEFIFIDEGSTTLQILPHLQHIQSLTILTNSFSIIRLLMQYENQQAFHGKIIFLGGEVNSSHQRVCGAFSEKMLEHFYVDKAFISVDGICAEHGLTSLDAAKATLSNQIIKMAKETYILADHSKLGVRDYYKIANLEDTDYIICDQAAPASWSKKLRASHTRWIKAD